MKNCKTFYEAQTASRLKEILEPPPTPLSHQIKSDCVFGTKIFLGRYTEYATISFKNADLGRQEIVPYKCFS